MLDGASLYPQTNSSVPKLPSHLNYHTLERHFRETEETPRLSFKRGRNEVIDCNESVASSIAEYI